MAQKLRDMMTTTVDTVEPTTTIQQAAEMMRRDDVGDVLVAENGQLRGIVTDRDIVIRALAQGMGMDTAVSQICTTDLEMLGPDDETTKAVETMRRRNIRRLPVVEGGRAVGIISLGDLAMERDEQSALADISSAPGQK